MKYFIKISILFFPLNVCYAQYANTQIKENFDYLCDYNNLYNWEYLFFKKTEQNPLLPINNSLNNRLGDRYADVLSALLLMYETTGDKAYLVKFVALTYHIQVNLRQDNGVISYPGWRDFLNDDYNQHQQDGNTIAPMAEYVYLLKNNNQLYNTPLPPINVLGNTFDALIYPANSANIAENIYTYGGFAEWLSTQILQTLNSYLNNQPSYFTNQTGFRYIETPLNKTSHNSAIDINQQGGFSKALLYMGLALNDNQLLQKSFKIAQLYKSSVVFLDHCFNGSIKMLYNAPVMQTSNNAYWWYHRGWSVTKHECNKPKIFTKNFSDYIEWVDDISHALNVLALPLSMHKTNNTQFFTNTDMVKWHNTFTQLIHKGGNNFSANVLGFDDAYPCGGTCVPNQFKYTALGYAPFSVFDDLPGATGSIYTTLMNLYDTDIKFNSETKITDGNQYLGVAELTNEQWNRECVNLSLYKRNMVYNQDFTVKNNISVEPNSNSIYNSPESYAEPKISTAEFTIEPGITVNMLAGEEIHLADGFHAKAGSNFHAGINPNMCTDGGRVAGGNTGHDITLHKPLNINENLMGNEEVSIEKPKQQWLVFPNPAQQELNVLGTIDENVQLTLLDMSGRTIWQHHFAGTFYTADVSNLEQGIYILQINTSKHIQTKKIFVRQ